MKFPVNFLQFRHSCLFKIKYLNFNFNFVEDLNNLVTFSLIKFFLEKEDLILNKKTRIYSSKDNFIFLGKNLYGNPSKYRSVKRKIKNKKNLYFKNKIKLRSLTSTIICYKHIYPNMFIDENKLF